MSTRHLTSVVALALAVPLGLALLPALSRSAPALPEQAVLNWLFMAAPQVVVVAVALFFARFRAGAATALVALTLLLLVFQLWVWWRVPVHESALAWVLYFPLALGTVLLVVVVRWLAARRASHASAL